MAKKEILYPITTVDTYDSKKGSLKTYASEWDISKGDVEFVSNREFTEELEYTGYSRGRSSVTVEFTNQKGQVFSMFISDFNDLLNSKDIINKRVVGTWTFCKKGQNYGLRLIKEELKEVEE